MVEGAKRVRVIGVGPGDPDQVTLEAVRALREVDYFVVTDKSGRGGMPDPLVHARERLLDRHLDAPPVIVRVDDPERERRPDRTATQEQYDAVVAQWHEARRAAYAEALDGHEGVAGFLVWGDPAFYDSTIRILDALAERMDLEVDVVPGISSIQLLAARHRIVLHEVGQALHVTSGRRLMEAVEQHQDNVVVMLNRVIELTSPQMDLSDWTIWWGGNLGTPHEELVSGRVGDVLPEVDAARERLRESVGWVMDIFLLRRML
ncbi:precorrin-6A synthase (deacetylating) [Nocardioides mangrovi]|uniref:Precorrin-6A synthase (Deacetylating) n=1 Tax=Nocardioides mangrovi TaxID=2874580 RepID=A0ABS7U797_9ACTN|nr:precorrin-6A synthase (deacetylating) [Nocardioides mangrovi]MBZ5736557.1 precorrin-6A synthase (deacetylating) [Nocardioides mangrovi]